jgi:hypothetical protein
MSIFAEATKRAAKAKFKQRDVDAEGQEINVRMKGEQPTIATSSHFIISFSIFPSLRLM